ncbi:mas-related G-protein coupled receptor member H-like [Alligator mississippiensis]|uniref:mas-related G-protein coupled receptor member H-like n=1 Tax=Alligator mississippiensis TaxID=8496 RepID=UPI0028778B05|nr:mas-related G-protein coupled receptor member H-like [Alligator mississippiensis]
MVGNGIVIWFLGFRIKRNAFSIYILNLAAADFGYLLCIAVETVQYLMQFNIGVQFGIFLFLDLFVYGTGLYLLTTISIERCLSVLFPVWFRCHRPKHLSSIMSALLWALSFLICGLGYISCSIGFVLSCVNSSLNPVIYFLVGSYRDRRFRDTLKVALQKVFEEELDCRGEQETTDADPEMTPISHCNPDATVSV